jgi:murein DD-endopeptidase MepM/ murein hydrolase activator NlpD
MDVYQSQGGDTLNIVAKRFALNPDQIIAAVVLPPPAELIPPNTLLLVPKASPDEELSPAQRSIPDSEIVYGPSASGFSTQDYVMQADGYLARYVGSLSSDQISGIQAVERISQENSLSPRIMLAIIEYESHWVLGQPTNLAEDEYPLGFIDYLHKGLFRQLMWASGMLSDGYYRWRSGDLTEITFTDGTSLRLSPFLNAGTAAIQYYFAQNHTRAEWEQAVAPNGFPALYTQMFGSAWERAELFEPTIPNGLVQPVLSLPFRPGQLWALTSGPHSAWEKEGALAALDFAPGALEDGCVTNDAWVLAPAAGKVVRTGTGVVMLDLDGDGKEQTGWVILFMHIRSDGKVSLNDVLQKDDPIGHASCEGGISTGTHIHIARKYNGEWMLADGPLAFNLDGWIAHNGEAPYKGSLTRGEALVIACTCTTFETNIIRDK